MTEKIHKSDEEWKQQLTPEQYYVTRRAGTEPAFSGPYYHHKATGTYHCICCENPLFRSEHKFESGTGWPSFTQPSNEEALETTADHSYGMTRVEVTCSRCNAQRFCINSLSLRFKDSSGD